MKNIDCSAVHVRQSDHCKSAGNLQFAHHTIACILGAGGIRAHKREGDGATPAGIYNILYGFYRADRVGHLTSKIKLIPIKQNYGWCDDPASCLYNRFVELPAQPSLSSHEKLWRDDNLYDLCLVLDHNMHPRQRNGGSAIFFHLKHPDNLPTQGCIAISLASMKKFLTQCDPQCRLFIHL